MSTIKLLLDGDGAWSDLQGCFDTVLQLPNNYPISIITLEAGMKSGRPSVGIRMDFPDGEVAIAQTSARLFVTAARVILARYPNLFQDEPEGDKPDAQPGTESAH